MQTVVVTVAEGKDMALVMASDSEDITEASADSAMEADLDSEEATDLAEDSVVMMADMVVASVEALATEDGVPMVVTVGITPHTYHRIHHHFTLAQMHHQFMLGLMSQLSMLDPMYLVFIMAPMHRYIM